MAQDGKHIPSKKFKDNYDSDEEQTDFVAPRKRGPTINVKKTSY